MPVSSGAIHTGPLLLLVLLDSLLLPGVNSECKGTLHGRTGAESNMLGDFLLLLRGHGCPFLRVNLQILVLFAQSVLTSTRQGMDGFYLLAFYYILQCIVKMGPFSRLIVHLPLDDSIDAFACICGEYSRRLPQSNRCPEVPQHAATQHTGIMYFEVGVE